MSSQNPWCWCWRCRVRRRRRLVARNPFDPGRLGRAARCRLHAGLPSVGNLARHLHGTSLPPGFSSADATPALLARLPAAVHQAFVLGYAESIQTVFIVAVPIAMTLVKGAPHPNAARLWANFLLEPAFQASISSV